ncbi:MAG: hypothetical protein A3F82_10350 [Deltaproteobacteria bacterium RIFCSPLOWO2_12_FULL_44_12]|nr:MAG: hypothetical protein A2712_07720 [Deltaproteobacteria bacterium RIFCSPHIGHO2_01_FULL_43_49]OGQ14770.1 MAG: hypothetical protein A3D22_09275 [Deltaproteobacteria bacterium RIFCSPHIGHO2_02_FULL_44_53]OGQ28156.1 MAG: hypothetical protein A3D98_07985 [Deltaproteobacteria bacterium RIFCSPHIGHO2_12_FULL_44_21]OGQ31368.1 MAG: hypothetical protein A2979_08035 [Deltaproteobacteria bacterium RIFCSPLOWO2_01_FULL_45_74]OGQ43360.1 MAG: hypothetical protein A3I70_01695 [Deltaproteobacteria bacterium 
MKKAVPLLIGIGEVQRGLSQILRRLDEEEGDGFIVSHNEPKAVLMSLKRYEKLKHLEEARSNEEEEVLAVVKQGDEEYELGKTKTAKSLKALL